MAVYMLKADTRIVLITGPGGVGKSRFLREVPSLLRKASKRHRREPWIVKNIRTSVDEALANWVPLDRPVLLCHDDATPDDPTHSDLARLAHWNEANIKIVLTVRDCDRYAVESILHRDGRSFETLQLRPLPANECELLTRAEIPSASDKQVARIVDYSSGNLYLLRELLSAIGAGESISSSLAVARRVADKLLRDVSSALDQDLPDSAVTRLVFELALRVPVVRDRAGRPDLDIKPCDVGFPNGDSLDEMLAVLERARVLRTSGRSLRFRSDMEADLFLLANIERPTLLERTSKALSTSGSTSRVCRNLVAVGDRATSLFQSVVDAWRKKVSSASADEISEQLNAVPYIAVAAPTPAYAYIEAVLVAGWCDPTQAFTNDEIGPVVQPLSRAGRTDLSINLVRMLASKGRKGKFANYSIEELARRALHPQTCSASAVSAGFETMLDWFSGAIPESAGEVASHAAAFWLGGGFQWEESDRRSFSMRPCSFGDVPIVRETRDRATALIRCMIESEDLDTRHAGLQAFGKSWRPGSMAGTGPAIRKRMSREASRLIGACAPLVHAWDYKSVSLWFSAIFSSWLKVWPGHQAAERALRNLPWTIELSVYCYVHQATEWAPDIHKILDTAPKPGRWAWWVTLESRQWSDGGHLKELARTLRRRVRAPGKTRELLNLVWKGADESAALRARSLLEIWCSRRTKTWTTVAEDPLLHAGARRCLESILEREQYRQDPDLLARHVNSALQHDNDVDTLQRLTSYLWMLPTASLRSALEAAPRQTPMSTRIALLELLHRRDDINDDAYALLLAESLRAGDWSDNVDELWTLTTYKRRLDGEAGYEVADLVLQTITTMACEGAREDYHACGLASWAFERRPDRALATAERLLKGSNFHAWDDVLRAALSSCGLNYADALRALCDWVSRKVVDDPAILAPLIAALKRPPSEEERVRHALALAKGTEDEHHLACIALEAMESSAVALTALATLACDDAASPVKQKRARKALSRSSRPWQWSGTPGEVPSAWQAAQRRLSDAISLCMQAESRRALLRLREENQNSIEEMLSDDATFDDAGRW